MSYHFSKTVSLPFDKAVAATTEALKNHGFGVLTQIDVKDTLNKKIGADFRPYLILGACNPKLAYEALTLEDKIGTMLPCNVVVQQREAGAVECLAAQFGRGRRRNRVVCRQRFVPLRQIGERLAERERQPRLVRFLGVGERLGGRRIIRGP